MAVVPESRGSEVIAVTVVFTVLAAIFVTARLVARVGLLKNGGLDELAIVVSMTASLGLLVGTSYEVKYGLGKHFSDVKIHDFQNSLMWLWISIILYNIALTFTKFSIVLQCLRVFVGHRMRLSCWIMLALIAAYGTQGIITAIFSCVPVSAFWTGDPSARCISRKFLWFFNASFNILTDIAILILPMPALSSLKLPRKQKFGLMGIFAVGGFICLVSILRLSSLYVVSRSSDMTWDNTNSAIWSDIEVNTAIICASLPTIKPVISRLFPRLLSSSHKRTGAPSYNYSHSHGANTNPMYNLTAVHLTETDVQPKTVTKIEARERRGSGEETPRSAEQGGKDIFITTSMQQDVERKSDMGSEQDLII